jgi:hypothetical protein
MPFMWFDDSAFAPFRARLVGINSPFFLLFSPCKGSLVLANAAKPPFRWFILRERSFQFAVASRHAGLRNLGDIR